MEKHTKSLFVLTILLAFVAADLLAAGAQDEPQMAEDTVFNATGLPIVNEPVTFDIVALKAVNHAPYAEMGVFQQLEMETGVQVEWIEVPASNFDEKKNLILASGDLPDIFMHGINDSDQLLYGPRGVFIALEDLIDQYAPNLAKIFEERPEIRSFMTTPDGHMYVLPRIQELSHRITPDNMFINKTWLDTLGLEIPTTTEEYHQVLTAFRNEDPNGNGKRDELPLSFMFPSGSEGPHSLFGSFGILDVPWVHLVVENGTVVFSPSRNEYKNGMEWLQQLYTENLIDPEVFTHDRQQYLAKGKEADVLYGSFLAWFDENVVGNDRARNDYVTLPPLKGPEGDQKWGYSPFATFDRQNFAITSECDYPEVAMRWANEMYTPDKSFQICWGPWDVVIERQGDRIIPLPAPEGMTQAVFRFRNAPVYTAPFYLDAEDFNNTELGMEHVRKIERLEIYKPYFPSLAEVYPKVYFTADESEELAILQTDLASYVDQMFARWTVRLVSRKLSVFLCHLS